MGAEVQNVEQTTAKPGRPRCFCEEAALDAAMRVFWAKGYEGASLTDLTAAMGINRPSLYAAFGDKQRLFERVLERYGHGPAGYLDEALKEPTVREVIQHLFRGSMEVYFGKDNPGGCLGVHGAIVTGDDAKPAHEALLQWRKEGERKLERRMKRAQKEGDLPASVDAVALTRNIFTILYGTAVQAAYGASRREIESVMETTLQMLAPIAWPSR